MNINNNKIFVSFLLFIQILELYNAVCVNLELGIPVLDALWSHFSDFYITDEEILPPLQFNNIYTAKDPDVTIKVEKNN